MIAWKQNEINYVQKILLNRLESGTEQITKRHRMYYDDDDHLFVGSSPIDEGGVY